jgi:large subunit ribosomal protein L25
MEEIFLEVENREELGRSKVKDLREKGFIVGVVYSKEKKSQAVKISSRQLLQLMHQHRLENIVLSLKMKGDNKHKAQPCLIKEIQYDPVKGNIIHVDFNEISLTRAIKVNVPVVSKGEPIGVKQEGGSLEHILWEVEIECLPTDMPKEIAADVSQLKIGDDIRIKDITFPSNIKVLTNIEAIVFSVAAPIKEEVAAAPVEGEVQQEPEVIKEKKEVATEEKEEEKNK